MAKTKPNINWHKKFFTGLWNEAQIKMFSQYQTLQQTKFIIDVLKIKRKDKVLDIPCGDGRISNLLAKKGIEVTGIDINPVMLRRAIKFAKSKKLNSKFINKNMWEIDYENEFDAALCYWGSFGYFDDETNMLFLEKVFKALKRGGRFLIDTHIIETLLTIFQPNGWTKMGDILITETRTYDVINSRILSNWTLIRNGKAEKHNSSIRLYSYKELTDILKDIGFKNFTAYSSIKKGKFDINARRLFLVAKK